MSERARTLPLRVPPVPGEALDSWLETLARRHQVTVGMLVTALGWHTPGSPGGLVAGLPAGMLRRLEQQAGLPAGRLDVAVLDRYLLLGAARRRGSRYCPSCLAERDGRWLLAWRLGWTFACPAHGVLLCDTCPSCGQAPRGRAGRAGLNPPGTCANTIKRHEYCGADLRQVIPGRLAPGSPVLAAQRWTGILLTLDDARPAGNGDALSDLSIVGSWVLRQAPAAQFAGFGPAVLAAWRERNQPPPAAGRQPSRFPPASAALTAALAATAMTVLTGSDEQAIEQIRALLPPRAGPRRPRPAGLPAARWRQLSQPARGRFLRAMDPDLSPADRIRYRTGTSQAAIPADPPGLLAARARAIPQLLWPDWAIRLMPAHGFAPGPFRSAIAACLLLPGQPGRATSTAITALHAYRSALAIGTVLRALADADHDTALTAISCLAGYLDTSGSPIDYQRRRDLIPAETITASQWRQLCYGAAAHPGETRRHRDAQRYLFQLLTGADLHDPRHALAFTSTSDYSHYHAFAGTLPTRLRDALHRHAAALLHDLGIGEPLTWSPPPGCCAGLELPGPEPDDIDLDAASRLIITDGLPVTQAAARLGTTGSHLRLALDRVPRPARQWGRSAAPLTWQRRQHARGILTREFFDREYIAAGKNLRQMEAETGIPRRFLTQVAREHGITMTGQVGPAPAGSCQPPGQDLTGTGSPAAQSLGDIRRAAGDSPVGWRRLRRFQIAMASPTIAAAAARLRICPSALSHQLRRLERDIGARLYQPATSRRPWRPTGRGAALLAVLARPDVQALAAAHAPDVSGRAGSRSRYRDRMPISLGPDAAAARQAATLFRVLASPTRLAILLTLQTGEQRITDLAAQLGGSQANISVHLIKLKKSGLITSRPQGRAVYYRLTQPELGALLQAAGQLLPPAGQQATEEKHRTARNPAGKSMRTQKLPQPAGITYGAVLDWDHNAYYHRLVLRQMPQPCRRVLDVGCGAGAFAARLAQRSEQVDALDRSPEMIEQAKRRTPGNVNCVLADVLADSLPGRDYDAVFSISALHHMPLQDALPVLAAALRPGGVLAAVALPRPDVRRELPVEIVAAVGHRLLGAMFLMKRLLGSKSGFAKDSARATMPVVMDPALTTREVARQAAAVLPGVRVRRLLFWRYLLIWQKPITPGS